MEPYEVRNQTRARVLLDSAKSYLPPDSLPVMRSMIDSNEPELAMDDVLAWLLARGDPLPKSLVNELLANSDLFSDFDPDLPDRLNQLARLAS
ncbi:MAG TPA: hypothetical protein VGQ50_05280 [Actinomycetota bacterium]|jgi:hypothetical protein|nr:hypothetical protein [Actinomycetota bacterium]